MSSLLIASIVFACLFGAALLGLFLRGLLPQEHLSADSKDVVKLAMGLVATMAALVLGLLTASAKTSFDTQNSEVQASAAHIIMLDRALAQYGPESQNVRALLRRAILFRLALTWPEDSSHPEPLGSGETTPTVEAIQRGIRALAAQTDDQRWAQSQALAVSGTLIETRWLMLAQASNPLPLPFLVVLIFWLALLFASFGLFAPRNATVVTALMLCAMAVAGSTFLILEMSRPLEGLIKISSVPLRYAVSQLGQ
ncbi:MAG: hypothetical protein ACRERC_17930 [Candidatus Binatia bacterium]